jgi:hypothetical protein
VLVEAPGTAAIAVFSFDFPSLPIADFLYLTLAQFPSFLSSGELSRLSSRFAMRTAAKKCGPSVSVSLALPVCISGLPLVRPSSGQELTPTVFAFDSEAASKELHNCTVGGDYAPQLESLLVPATMGTRGRTSGERLPAGENQATAGCSFDRSVG